jgi:hypothetical protein
MNRILTFALAVALSAGWARAHIIRHGNCVVDSELWALPACALETHNGKLFVSKVYLPLFFSSAGATRERHTPGNLASTFSPKETGHISTPPVSSSSGM